MFVGGIIVSSCLSVVILLEDATVLGHVPCIVQKGYMNDNSSQC